MDSGAARLSDTAQDPGFTRDDEFWYKDGSIVLVAQSVGFRVYRELLVERSAVFRDLFSLPQPSDSQRVCGCPVVHLSDTTIALKEFLAMLLRGKRCETCSPSEPSHINSATISDMTRSPTLH